MSDDRHNAPRAGRRANFLYLFVALLVLTIAGPVVEVTFGIIGGLFAEFYQLLHGYDPSSFSGVEQQQGHALSWRFLYFSFVTLTTLGYGDVLPLNIYAQTLTVMETVIGQFYLAILVAALVGAYLSDVRDVSDGDTREREPDR